jgi:choline dehydrogenase
MFQTPERHRETASTAFLNDAMFPNGTGTGLGANRLTVLLRTFGTRVLFNDNKRAIGLEAIKDGQTIRIRARKEVVLAGGMRSSHILELSGIGNATLLNSLGIPVIVDNPNVGEHLKNHPSNIHLLIYSDHIFGAPTAPTDPAGLFGGGGFFPEMLSNGSFAPANSSKSRDFQIVWSGTRFAPQILVLFVALDRPVSEGWVHAHSPDPLTNPFVDQRLAVDGDDLDRMVRFNYHFVQNTLIPYLQSQFFAAGGYLFPYGRDQWSNTTQAAEWTIANLIDASHYTGSNAMAPSAATGVVDGAGRVFGVKNLRVADSSIFPDITDGNTALMSMVVGDILGRTIAGVA